MAAGMACFSVTGVGFKHGGLQSRFVPPHIQR